MYQFKEKLLKSSYVGNHNGNDFFQTLDSVMKKKGNELLWVKPYEGRIGSPAIFSLNLLITDRKKVTVFDYKTGDIISEFQKILFGHFTYGNGKYLFRDKRSDNREKISCTLYDDINGVLRWSTDRKVFKPIVLDNVAYAVDGTEWQKLYRFDIDTGDITKTTNFKEIFNEPNTFNTVYVGHYDNKVLFARYGDTEDERGNKVHHSRLIEIDIETNKILRSWNDEIIAGEKRAFSFMACFQTAVFNEDKTKLLGEAGDYMYEVDLGSGEFKSFNMREEQKKHSLNGFRGISKRQYYSDGYLYVSAFADMPEHPNVAVSAIAAIHLETKEIVWSHKFPETALGINKPMVSNTHLYIRDSNNDLHVFERVE